MSICNKHLYCEKCECFINNMCFEPYTLNDLTTKYGKEPKKRYCGYNPIDTSERREKIRTMMGLDKDFNLHVELENGEKGIIPREEVEAINVDEMEYQKQIYVKEKYINLSNLN